MILGAIQESLDFIPKVMLSQKDIEHGNGINRFVLRTITRIGINERGGWIKSYCRKQDEGSGSGKGDRRKFQKIQKN